MEDVQKKEDSGAKSRNRRLTSPNQPTRQYKLPFSITIDKNLLSVLDEHCKSQNRKRSNVVEAYIELGLAREKQALGVPS